MILETLSKVISHLPINPNALCSYGGGESFSVGHLLPASGFAVATNSPSGGKGLRGSGNEEKIGSPMLQPMGNNFEKLFLK